MTEALERLTAALDDRYKIERNAERLARQPRVANGLNTALADRYTIER